LLSKLAKVLAAPVIIGVLGIPVVANAATQAPASGARHVTATANTHLTNLPDYGYNSFFQPWAVDNLRRTATVTLLGTAPYNKCAGNTSTQACYQYTGTISDTGTAKALTGAKSPGAQDVAIKGTPTATVNGHGVVNFYASSNAPTGALVPTAVSGPSSTTANWVRQFFPAGTRFSAGNFMLATWTWKYVDAKNCQTWIYANNVSAANSGDITGVSYCIPPRGGIKLSGGRSHSVSPTRQNYSWVQSGPSWDRLTIVGPGPINGHVGYVNAMHAGRITAYYTGLESGHTYVVTIQPQFYKGGPPAGKAGRVTFITV
jgi:hypothetical protein